MYEDATLNNVPLKLTLNKEPLEQALSVICSQAGMRYELVENNYVLILPIDRNAKRRTITGVIKDDMGEPVIGASIVIQGTTFGTVANMDGQFMLSYPENTKNDELMISFIGMQTVKEKIGNRHVFNVKMESGHDQSGRSSRSRLWYFFCKGFDRLCSFSRPKAVEPIEYS